MPYNGYENYETWYVSAFIANDQDLLEAVQQDIEDTENGYDTAKIIQDIMENIIIDPIDTLVLRTYILQAFLDSVNWLELAEVLQSEE